MSEKPEESFDDDEEDEDVPEGDESLDLDEIIRDLDSTKRRRSSKTAAEPAWRKLERYLEERRTAELLSDFDDYMVGDEPAPAGSTHGKSARGRGKRGG